MKIIPINYLIQYHCECHNSCAAEELFINLLLTVALGALDITTNLQNINLLFQKQIKFLALIGLQFVAQIKALNKLTLLSSQSCFKDICSKQIGKYITCTVKLAD